MEIGSLAPHILRIDCPDQPGLVHKITGVLYNAGYNVLSNQEFVDLESQHFFMRTALKVQRRRIGWFLTSNRFFRKMPS